MKIYIDPGHGGHDSGAVGNGFLEKDLVLDISLRQKDLFEKLGHKVKMSRTTDKFVSLSDRANNANNWGADVFISNHINAGGGEGIEVWHSIYGGKGKEYASNVEKELSKIFKSRGLKSRKGSNGDYLYVIRATSMPAILNEFGFIDNIKDTNKLKNSTFRQQLAEAVVNSITGKQVANNNLDGRMAICTGNGVRLRSTTDTRSTSNILGHLNKGDKIKIFKKVGNMYSVYYGAHGAYISADYISLI